MYICPYKDIQVPLCNRRKMFPRDKLLEKVSLNKMSLRIMLSQYLTLQIFLKITL